ncbi:MAG: ribosomal protein S18-alanine N-acetyltransferase [Candidatus Methylomirabilis sp.]|nr:ribosomal protein S18-alanine N-acetyltransferase [Candidatus Methylomirabilis sp.]
MSKTRLAVTCHSMGREDLPEVLVIESLSFAEPWTEEMFLGEFSSEGIAESLVARVDEGPGERIVGFLCAWVVGGELHINNIGVHPSYRLRGIASQLLEEVLRRARVKEATAGYLEVRASNEAAAGLYRCYGFQPIGRRRNYYDHPQEDAIVMRKTPL